MTDSERIAALEQELAQALEHIANIARVLQHHLGVAAASHGAISALIESHHDIAYLEPALEHNLLRVEAEAISLANNENCPEGVSEGRHALDFSLHLLRETA